MLKPLFSKSDLRKHFLERVKVLDQTIHLRLQRIGEQFVADARNDGNYIDQTGNLRSSIGYVIMKNGREVVQGFPGTGEGQVSAKKLVDTLKKNWPSGYVLIVVAGMDYAAAVEANGKDVITGSSQIAEVLLKRLFR
jgi:hypothetical protein